MFTEELREIKSVLGLKHLEICTDEAWGSQNKNSRSLMKSEIEKKNICNANASNLEAFQLSISQPL